MPHRTSLEVLSLPEEESRMLNSAPRLKYSGLRQLSKLPLGGSECLPIGATLWSLSVYRPFSGSANRPVWVSSSALLETSGVRIPVVSSFEEVVGPILRLAGRQLVCVGRVRRPYIIIGSTLIGATLWSLCVYRPFSARTSYSMQSLHRMLTRACAFVELGRVGGQLSRRHTLRMGATG